MKMLLTIFQRAWFEVKISISYCQQQFLDFLQSRADLFLRQAWEFSAERDEIALAREHQLVILDLDNRHGLFAGQDFEFGHLQQQFHRRWQQAEAVTQFLL